MRESQAQIEALIARERSRGVAARRIVLAGFSQGGAIALHAGLRHAMGISSFASGALVSAAGSKKMNAGVLPVLVIVALAVLWLAWLRAHRSPAAAAR